MARFSVGGEADEGASSPRRKRQRTPNILQEDEEDLSEEEESLDEEQEDDNDDDDGDGDGEGEEEQSLFVNDAEPPRSSNAHVPVGPSRNNGISVTLIDPEVLDCPICYESLTVPVFQCENGHTACSSCCKKVANKCPSCSLPIGYNRCRAIEKVLESVKLPCQNQKYGCREMVRYSKKFDHDKICKHAPCSCPIAGCSFVGSDRQLYQHFSNKHKNSAIKFQYGVTLPAFFTLNDKSLILQEEKEGVLFILNNREEFLGNVLSINCIGSSLTGGYSYELAAKKSEGSNLRFQSFTKSVAKVSNDDIHSKEFLVVPGSFFGSYGQISLDLCIWQHGPFPASLITVGAKSQRTDTTNTRMRYIDAFA